MTYKIKYFLANNDKKPHIKYIHALNKSTAIAILKTNLGEKGYSPHILEAVPVVQSSTGTRVFKKK